MLEYPIRKVFRVNRRYAESRFGVACVSQVIETRDLEHDFCTYVVVHIDDQDVLLERERVDVLSKNKVSPLQ